MEKTALYPLFPQFFRNSSESIRTKIFGSFFVQIAPIIELQIPNCGKIAENTLFFPISSHLFIDKLFAGATDYKSASHLFQIIYNVYLD